MWFNCSKYDIIWGCLDQIRKHWCLLKTGSIVSCSVQVHSKYIVDNQILCYRILKLLVIIVLNWMADQLTDHPSIYLREYIFVSSLSDQDRIKAFSIIINNMRSLNILLKIKCVHFKWPNYWYLVGGLPTLDNLSIWTQITTYEKLNYNQECLTLSFMHTLPH